MATTIQATGKSWKAAQAIGLVLFVVGFFAMFNGATPLVMLAGLAVFLGSRLGAWWMHGAIVLALLSGTPAIAGDSGYIIGGKSRSPKQYHRHHRHEHRRDYDRPRYRSGYQPRDQVIIIVPQYEAPRRSRYQPLFGGL